MASLLVTVIAIALSFPMAAHANMTDNGTSIHNGMNLAQSDHAHDISAMDMTSLDSTNHEHEGVGCCETGMCSSAALVENYNFSEVDQVRAHIALPISKMTSAGKSRLMRPPSL